MATNGRSNSFANKYASPLVAAASTVTALYAIFGPTLERLNKEIEQLRGEVRTHGALHGHPGTDADVVSITQQFATHQSKLDAVAQRLDREVNRQDRVNDRTDRQIGEIRETQLRVVSEVGHLRGRQEKSP